VGESGIEMVDLQIIKGLTDHSMRRFIAFALSLPLPLR